MLLGSLIASLFFRWALIAAILLETVTVLSYQNLSPEQRFSKTVWQQSWRRTLDVRKIDNDRYKLRNVRDFLYRSENDYEVRYRDLTVSLERLSSIDVAFSHWDNLEEIAHSMLGLNFTDGTTVVISLETRLPEGVDQNALDGFYRRYELAMIAGTPEGTFTGCGPITGERPFTSTACRRTARICATWRFRSSSGRRNCSGSRSITTVFSGTAPRG